MSFGFLLRFQEATTRGADERMAKASAVVEKEKPEGRVRLLAGTKTITEVKQEAADNDPGSLNFYALPH
jgi:hypothetical protein